MGGEIRCGWEVKTIDELPQAKSYLFDTAPKGLLQIAGQRMPEGYRRQLEGFRYNQGVFKIDWALSEPVPWAAEACRRTATLHLGGTMEEIVASEADVWKGKQPTDPYMLVAQQSVVDPTRAPEGKHTLWAYCHAPAGSTADLTDVLERQVERFAPGFRDTIIARATRNSVEMERYNPNYVGGDINAGVQDLMQQFTRPIIQHYTLPHGDRQRVYLLFVHATRGWGARVVRLLCRTGGFKGPRIDVYDGWRCGTGLVGAQGPAENRSPQ